MPASELTERVQNGLRDFTLYSENVGHGGRRARIHELIRNLAIGLGATSLRGHQIQFVYRGYKIPLDLAEMTGAADESWEDIGFAHLDYYERWTPIGRHDSVLEIGCGVGRDAILLAGLLSSDARYVGIDIIRPSIEWCRRNITKRHPNFEFIALDVRSSMYNPTGTATNASVRFPLPDASFDRVVLHSVFTHMFVDDIAHYLHEISRVMRDDATVLASFFVVDEARTARSPSVTSWTGRVGSTIATTPRQRSPTHSTRSNGLRPRALCGSNRSTEDSGTGSIPAPRTARTSSSSKRREWPRVGRRRFLAAGAGASGRADISERIEEILASEVGSSH